MTWALWSNTLVWLNVAFGLFGFVVYLTAARRTSSRVLTLIFLCLAAGALNIMLGYIAAVAIGDLHNPEMLILIGSRWLRAGNALNLVLAPLLVYVILHNEELEREVQRGLFEDPAHDTS